MNDIAIHVEGLGKQYRIGAARAPYKTLRESLVQAVQSPFRRLRQGFQPNADNTFWALKDVSFEVKRGEVVGIIGRNGAGKSTLLKILSRITEPTEGLADIYGRVGSLLEVGTGFHPELTGRENIYLSGAILGMKRTEIERKFDEIVDFAEVEKFLDTPVKRYSSGMYVRLAFAVAAHLEPDILMVDEVLSVGDAAFQKKCLGKMENVAKEGQTVLFVSHNMAAIRGLCTTAILLESGRLCHQNSAADVVDMYHATLATGLSDRDSVELPTSRYFTDLTVDIVSQDNIMIYPLAPVEIRVSFTARQALEDADVYSGVFNVDHDLLFGLDHLDVPTEKRHFVPANHRATFTFCIPQLPLMPGSYYVKVHIKDQAQGIIEVIDHMFTFSVEHKAVNSTRILPRHWFGDVAVPATGQFWAQSMTKSDR